MAARFLVFLAAFFFELFFAAFFLAAIFFISCEGSYFLAERFLVLFLAVLPAAFFVVLVFFLAAILFPPAEVIYMTYMVTYVTCQTKKT